MKPNEINSFTIGPRLTLTFALLMLVILGGNGLVIWQFQTARLQTYRSIGVSQQLIAVLQLQNNLLSLHLRLDELARSQDPRRLATEGAELQRTLLQQTQQTRSALTSLSPQTAVDPALLPTLQAIEITLPTQIEAIAGLAQTGDWEAVRLRLGNELKPLETQTSVLVDHVNQQVSREMLQAVTNMESVQRRILVIVPAIAIVTFSIAAIFGWSIARRINELRLEERVGERTRIARDLHDTLLQSFQGTLLKLHAVTYIMRDRPEEAQRQLETAIEKARQAITEGRDAIQGMRSSTLTGNDLAHTMTLLGNELTAQHKGHHRSGDHCPEVHVQVEGTPRELAPILRDDIYRISGEAVRNAFLHAKAERIEVEIRYDARKFRLRVRDDGKGIDPKVLEAGAREGHYGLPGMRERAKLVGAKLAVRSEPESGTEIEVTIPASIAYAKSSADHRPMFWRKEA
jgi:signal transduction histidine kinase